MKSNFQLLITAALVLLFSYAAVSKLTDTQLFRAQLYLQPFPKSFADRLVYAIPALELLSVVFLVIDATRWTGLWLSFTLMSGFTAYIAAILIFFGDKLPCSCGGILNRMPWTAHLFFNLFFVTAAAVAIRIHHRWPKAKTTV